LVYCQDSSVIFLKIVRFKIIKKLTNILFLVVTKLMIFFLNNISNNINYTKTIFKKFKLLLYGR